MNTVDTDKAWQILTDRKPDRKESRVAFIAALIMARCGPHPSRSDADEIKRPSPFMAEAFAVELVRLARHIKAEAEAACSVERTPAQVKTGERNEARFAAIAAPLGFEARTGGDPRGACAYLIDPDDRKGDGWGDGWAVYA